MEKSQDNNPHRSRRAVFENPFTKIDWLKDTANEFATLWNPREDPRALLQLRDWQFRALTKDETQSHKMVNNAYEREKARYLTKLGHAVQGQLDALVIACEGVHLSRITEDGQDPTEHLALLGLSGDASEAELVKAANAKADTVLAEYQQAAAQVCAALENARDILADPEKREAVKKVARLALHDRYQSEQATVVFHPPATTVAASTATVDAPQKIRDTSPTAPEGLLEGDWVTHLAEQEAQALEQASQGALQSR